jgi:hypothetical protein
MYTVNEVNVKVKIYNPLKLETKDWLSIKEEIDT